MYNQELKERFLSTVMEGSVSTYKGLFNRMSKYENLHGIDIYQMSVEQLSEALESSSGAKKHSQRNTLGAIRRYIKWLSSDLGIETSQAVWEINELGLSKIKKTMVSSPEMLHDILNLFLNKVEFATVDNVHRSIWWMLFMGILPEKVNTVRKIDVDLNKRIINFENRQYDIYDQAYSAIKMCVNSNSFLVTRPNYTHPIQQDRLGNGLLDGLKTVLTPRNASLEMKKRKRALKNPEFDKYEITPDKVWMSGEFYRTKLAEDQGLSPDFSGLVDDVYKKSSDDIEEWREAQSKRSLYLGYLDDYKTWKTAFYY